MNKNLFKIAVVIVLASVLSGCSIFRNPLHSWAKANTKVNVAQTNLVTVDKAISNDGAKYLYSTKLALTASPTNDATKLAADFNNKAIGVFGSPSTNDIGALQIMVGNLLSSNKTLIANGTKAEAALNGEVSKLQSERTSLAAKLSAAQENLEKVGAVNSALAAKWEHIVKIFWFGVYAVIAVIVLRVVTMFLPPPYNGLSAIISVPAGWLVSFITWAVPEVVSGLGWVAKELEGTPAAPTATTEKK